MTSFLLAESRLRRFQRNWGERFFWRPAKSGVFAGVRAWGRRFQRNWGERFFWRPAKSGVFAGVRAWGRRFQRNWGERFFGRPAIVYRLGLVSAGAAALTLAVAVSEAHAEQVYVIEQLVVSVVGEAGGAGERIGQVKSGDKLELIDRQGEEVHIRLANGKEGWIKASYVSAEEPLTHRLSERTAEVDKLKQDVSRLESELASARASRKPPPTLSATSQLAAPSTSESRVVSPTPAPARTLIAPANNPPDPPAASAAMSEAQSGHEVVFLRSPDPTGETPWTWVLGTSGVMLLIGFALGWRTLDRRIRRKYGGLRIY
jgi:hypothetical protein